MKHETEVSTTDTANAASAANAAGTAGTAVKKLMGDGIADEREVLEVLTRILRREATEDTAVKLRTESRSTDEDGETVVERGERVEIVKTRPRLADVTRAAELVGKYHGMFGERLEGSIALPLIICGEDELK